MKKLDIEFYRAVVPDVDHSLLNSLRNASEKPIEIPVTLYEEGQEVLKASVRMIGTSVAQYRAALWIVLRELGENDIDIEWDACSFLRNEAEFTRLECFKNDPLLTYLNQDQKKSYKDVFNDETQHNLLELNSVQSREKLSAILDGFGYRMIASAINHTAEVISEDIEKIKKQQPWHVKLKRNVLNLI